MAALASESVAALNRNQWPFWIGISGRFASECALLGAPLEFVSRETSLFQPNESDIYPSFDKPPLHNVVATQFLQIRLIGMRTQDLRTLCYLPGVTCRFEYLFS